MELALTITVAVLFALVGLVCVASIAVSLPGAWIMIALAVGIELADALYLPEGDRQTFSWWVLGACVGLAAVGEILEFIAGALGAKKAGSSRAGMIGAIIGGVAGAIMLALAIPPFGPLVGAIAGTFAGAVLGELSGAGATVRDTIKPATGATIGRILGTLSKLPVGVAIWAALSVAAFWP